MISRYATCKPTVRLHADSTPDAGVPATGGAKVDSGTSAQRRPPPPVAIADPMTNRPRISKKLEPSRAAPRSYEWVQRERPTIRSPVRQEAAHAASRWPRCPWSRPVGGVARYPPKSPGPRQCTHGYSYLQPNGRGLRILDSAGGERGLAGGTHRCRLRDLVGRQRQQMRLKPSEFRQLRNGFKYLVER